MTGGQAHLSPYPPAGPAAAAARAWRIMIKTEAAPGVLPRILEQLAKRSLVPDEVQCRRRVLRSGVRLTVRIVIALDEHMIGHICRCWSGTPDVISVERTAHGSSRN